MNGEAISLEALLGLPTASWSPAGSLHNQQRHLALGGGASCCGSLVDPVPSSWQQQQQQQQTYASLADNNNQQQHYSAASLVDDPLGISSLGEVYGGMSSCQPPHPISQEWPSLAQCHTLALDGERQAQEAMLALQALQQQQEIMLLQRHINSLTPLQAHQLLAHVQNGPSSLDLPLHSSEGLINACGTPGAEGMALPARSLSATTLAAGGMNAAMSASVRLSSVPFARLSAPAAPPMLTIQQQQQQQAAAMQQHQVAQQQQQQQRRLMQQASVGAHRHPSSAVGPALVGPSSPASSSSLPTGLTGVAGATAVTQTVANNNRPAGHPGRVPRSTSSLGRSHRHRKDAQPVTPKAPTWAGADWHPLKAVLASGQAAMAGTGVFLPHLSGLSSGSDVAASEPPSLLSFSDLESSTAFSALDSMDHALLTNSMSDMNGMFLGTPERPGMPSSCHSDYTAAVM